MSTMNKEKLKGLQSFLKDDIWRVTEDEVSKSRGIFYNAIKIATLSIREFTQGRIINKASALTYSTLLSSIPILAILFAIARGFGFSNLLETQFRSGLEGQSAAAETVLGLIDSYDRLLFHPFTSSAINRIVKRYIHLHDNDAEEHGRFRIAGTANEIYGQTYPFHTHMGYVYRTVCVYAQHKGKNQIRYHTRYHSRYCVPSIPISIYRNSDMGFTLQCHLW